MDLMTKAVTFIKEFNDYDDDDLHASVAVDITGIGVTLYEGDFKLAKVSIEDIHDLDNFIALCKRAREYGG